MKYVKMIGSFVLIAVGILLLLLLPGFISSMNSGSNDSQPMTKLTDKLPWKKKKTTTHSQRYAVSTSSTYATKVGEQVLKDGGNAVDAAVAVSYALALTEPYASGPGGGGGMIIYDPKTKQYHGVDYRDSAPRSAEQMVSPTGVPTFIKGMDYLSQHYGTKSMSKMMEPTIKLAQDGFQISPVFSTYIEVYQYLLADNPDYQNQDGDLLERGETMHPKKMLATLKAVQKQGPQAYYSGKLADEIAAKTTLEKSDLKGARVENAQPVVTKINQNEYATLPAPFSGVTMLQMLKLANESDLPDPQTDPDAYLKKYKHLKRLAYADRVKHMSDPQFNPVDSKAMVTDEYVAALRANNVLRTPAGQQEDDSHNTTHFSIVDQNGMTVSATNTLGNFYGSEIEAGGFYLNAANRLFSPSNVGMNKYEAGKKPRNFTSPTIIQTSQNHTIGIGTPGGNMIPEFMFQTLMDHLKYKTDFKTAIERNRLYLTRENQFVFEDNDRRKDYLPFNEVKEVPFTMKRSDEYFGSMQVVERNNKTGKTHAYYDTRRNGAAKAD
ncbi:MAG TPA: gamma-glutamyltransferase [Candidatus Ligilactobacillus excrementipullorum]|nr:gamma-glutamyltransferase [Candidatus Ligilactobacillus excrementipullorum]